MDKFFGGMLCALLAIWGLNGILGVLDAPVKEIGRDGECVRVLVIEKGQEVPRACSSLKTKRYQIRYVMSSSEQEEVARESLFAERRQ